MWGPLGITNTSCVLQDSVPDSTASDLVNRDSAAKVKFPSSEESGLAGILLSESCWCQLRFTVNLGA
jgi:hypothetical protein